ncbi:MAG: hypothetical protein A2V46_01675 [Bacteroidetes bacterium RBG_19FT_COMBO_42_7]|jgi:hypothetical protein|nr:MAG: hypothetical protein A2V46_01675 [Bacteroidetes bacterium RBG_19FT_COMBO_42_7]
MKKLSKFFSSVLFLTLALSGCEKLSDEELLTDHIWRWDKITSTSTNTDIQNIVTVTNALMTGATIEFRIDGTFTLTALNDSEDGTWELTDDNDTLILDGEEMTIVKLTKDELVLEGEEVDDEYGIYSATLHLKR